MTESERHELAEKIKTLEKELADCRKTISELRKSEERFKSVFNTMADTYYRTDTKGDVVWVSSSALRLLGYDSVDELIGLNLANDLYVNPEQRYELLNLLQKQGKVIDYKVALKGRDGRTVIVSTNSKFYRDENDEIAGVEGICRDVTDQEFYKKSLEESEAKLNAIFNAARDGIIVTNAKNRKLVTANQEASRMLQYTIEEFKELSVKDIHPEKDLPHVIDSFDKIAEGRLDIAENIPVQRKDGSVFFADISLSPPLQIGSDSYLIGVFRDITKKKQIEDFLRESEERFRSIFEYGPLGIVIVSKELKYIKANNYFCNMSGYKEEELLKMMVTDITHPDDIQQDRENAAKLLRGDIETYNTEKRYIKKNGDIIWVSLRATMIRDKEDKPLYFLSYAKDITKRKRAEKLLRDSEVLLRSVFDSIPGLLTVHDKDLRVVLSNWKNHEYIPAEKRQGSPFCYEVYMQRDTPCVPCQAMEVFKKGTSVRLERKNPIDNIVREINAYPIFNSSGEVIMVAEYIHDITERKMLEEERLKSKKLESLGLLAGGIAHDFNNMLMAILGNISIILYQNDPKDKRTDEFLEIKKAAERARELTQQLLTFSKGGAPIRRPSSLEHLIKETATFMLRGSKIKYSFESPQKLWRVNIDKGQISQVVQNLVLNTIQAMPEGGELVIGARNFVADEYCTLPLEKGKYVEVTFKDQGTGIRKEHLHKIFDPYFSTKKQGSGLGLSIVYSIIRNHEGFITAKSIDNQGATFIFYLPATIDREDIVQPEWENISSCSGTVILMDDDESVRRVASKMLTELGFEVVLADDGKKAIQLYIERLQSGKKTDAVILDLTVPGGMGGEETIKQLKVIDPKVKAFVSSGYAHGPIMAQSQQFGFIDVIPKPYEINELKKMLGKLSE